MSTNSWAREAELPARFSPATSFSVANARYSTATSPADDLEEIYEEGRQLRELLHADAVTLIGRDCLNPESLKDYTGLVGYKNVGTELQAVALLLSDNWETIRGRCATSEEELERALRISQRLQLGAGEREFMRCMAFCRRIRVIPQPSAPSFRS